MKEKPPIIKLYEGFASQEVTFIHGHVLRSVSKQREKITSNPFKNALEMYRRYNVTPMKKARVLLTHNGSLLGEAVADKKGYFTFKVKKKIPELFSYKVLLKEYPGITSEGTLGVSDPEQIIVSDIDDTILVSHSTSLLKKLYVLLTKNHESRKAYQGIRSFYNTLKGDSRTSFFYVSSSEWNLYDFLGDFIDFNDLPSGILLLQDLKSGLFDIFKSGGGSHAHKKDKIIRLIDTFPDATFTLVGDSGQKDPYLYKEIAKSFPDKIKAIYIRDVRSSKRSKVKRIMDELASRNIKMELFTNP